MTQTSQFPVLALYRNITDYIWQINQSVDLIYSEHDEEKHGAGWYLQCGRQTSKCFETPDLAIDCYYAGADMFR